MVSWWASRSTAVTGPLLPLKTPASPPPASITHLRPSTDGLAGSLDLGPERPTPTVRVDHYPVQSGLLRCQHGVPTDRYGALRRSRPGSAPSAAGRQGALPVVDMAKRELTALSRPLTSPLTCGGPPRPATMTIAVGTAR